MKMQSSYHVVCVTLVLCCLTVQAGKRPRKLVPGAGINFPRWPLSKSDAHSKVFNKTLWAVYRMSDPPIEGIVTNDMLFEATADGMIEYWDAKLSEMCESGSWPYHSVEGEEDKAVYDNEAPFPSTGQAFTNSFFSCNPEDHVFIFWCLDRTTEKIRHGRRVFCDGPWTMLFFTHDFPPDRVKWCAAEKDLWKNFHVRFDNDFMHYEPDGAPCAIPVGLKSH